MRRVIKRPLEPTWSEIMVFIGPRSWIFIFPSSGAFVRFHNFGPDEVRFQHRPALVVITRILTDSWDPRSSIQMPWSVLKLPNIYFQVSCSFENEYAMTLNFKQNHENVTFVHR